MTAPRGAQDRERERPPERDLKLGFGESIDVDVLFCDLVEGRDNEAPYQVRFRGYRSGTDERIRLYCDLDQIEGPMVHERVLAAAVSRPSRMDRETRRELALEKHALSITRMRTGGGNVRYVVKVRDDRDVQQYARAVGDAVDKVLPELTKRGFAVGAAEVLTVARDLVRGRHHQG